MALVRTTLSAAVAIGDKSIKVASASGFAVGYQIRVDQEQMEVDKGYDGSSTTIPVRRGIDGTAQQAHVSSAGVVCGVNSDWADDAAQTSVLYPIAGRARTVTSYSASGAISLPTAGADAVAVLNGTSVLTMTLANPGKGIEGSLLYVVANGAAAHTVTNTTGFGGAGSSYDVLTANGTGTCGFTLMAVNEKWIIIGPVGGTLTNVVFAIS